LPMFRGRIGGRAETVRTGSPSSPPIVEAD
jgi:hypothetical protein